MPQEPWKESLTRIGPDCRESFIPLDHPSVSSLKEKGIVMGGHSFLVPPYAMHRPEPGIDVALFTLSGRGLLRTERGQSSLTEGCLALLPAGLPYAYGIDGEDWEILWFHFGPDNFWKPAWERVERRETFSDLDRMARTMDDLLGDCHSPFPQAAQLAENMALALTILLDRKLHTYSGPRQYAFYLQFDALWNRVNGSLSEEWSVERMARELNLSASHFSRLCRELHGLSPSRRLRRFRLDRAKTLLSHKDFTVYQVAEMVGYGDPFAFSTAFKEHTGKTPREWRKR